MNSGNSTHKLYPITILAILVYLASALLIAISLYCAITRSPIFLIPIAAGIAAAAAAAVLHIKLLRSDRIMTLISGGKLRQLPSKGLIVPARGIELILKRLGNLVTAPEIYEENKRQAEYLALQNQINPHFLYNTLESIRSEALIGGLSDVASMTEYLARFFRYTISNANDTVLLEDEIRNVRDYFAIQRYRFGDRIKLEIDSSLDQYRKYRLPKLILQPIVENSVIHGIELKAEGGTVKIYAETAGDIFFVGIKDDGVGMNARTLEAMNRLSASMADPGNGRHSGIALSNVDRRLKLLFGSEYGLAFYSYEGIGTTVEIRLPILEALK